MTQSNNILQELKELGSSLADSPVQTLYSVPAGYFENLAAEIMKKIHADRSELLELSPVVNSISREMPYTVPAGYFESLTENIIQKLHAHSDYQSASEELESISPLLSGLKKETPFSVPDGYFDKVSIPSDKPAKLVSLSSKWMRYAAAAVVIGVIAVFAIVVTKDKVDPVNNSYSWVEKKMKKVSTDEIENFVELSTETATSKEAIAANSKSREVNQLVQELPVNVLQEFLDEIPQDEPVVENDIIMN